MGEANKVVSLLIGLFVVIVIFSVVASRLNIPERLRSVRSGGQEQQTPTPTSTPSEKIVVQKQITTGAESQPMQKKTADQESNEIQTYTPIEKGGTTKGGLSAETEIIKTKGDVTTIPATGAPTALFPLVSLGFLTGIYLRRKK